MKNFKFIYLVFFLLIQLGSGTVYAQWNTCEGIISTVNVSTNCTAGNRTRIGEGVPGTQVQVCLSTNFLECCGGGNPNTDYLRVYDAAGNILATWTCSTATGTCITVTTTDGYAYLCWYNATNNNCTTGGGADIAWSTVNSCGENICSPKPSLIMGNGSTTTCGSYFYDNGGCTGNYTANQNLVHTFCPATAGSCINIRFITFALQSSTGCVSDYFIVYDGPTTADPVLGRYCGTTLPPTLKPSNLNATGCLTIQFVSDGSTQAAGWKAEVFCGTCPAYCPDQSCPSGTTCNLATNSCVPTCDLTGSTVPPNNCISSAELITQCGTSFYTCNYGATANCTGGHCGGSSGPNYAQNLDCNNTTGSSGNDVGYSVENDIYYKFCPTATGAWTLTIEPSNCTSTTYGYQYAVFQGTETNLHTRIAGGVGGQNLLGPVTVNFNVTNTTDCFFIQIDGYGGVECVFAVNIGPTDPSVGCSLYAPGVTICHGQSATLTAMGSASGSTFNWYDQLSGGTLLFTGNPYVTPPLYTNTTYYVAEYLAGVEGPRGEVVVTVNPLPTISGTLTVCPGLTTQLTGSPTAAATTPWTSSNTSVATVNSSGLVTGVTSGSTIITYTNSNGCQQTATVIVNLSPTVDDPADQLWCANESTNAVTFTGNSGSTIYNWTNNNTTIGLAASGIGNIASFTTINSGTINQVATITVTPVLGSCTGTTQTFTITVKPIPTVNDPLDQVLCANQATNAVIFSGNIGLTTYNWSNNNISIGLNANGSGTINSFTAINNGTVPEVATITVTPIFLGCTGTSQNFTITVNPVPLISVVGYDPSICNGTDGYIEVTIPSNGTVNWSGTASGSSAALAPMHTISNLGAGSYTISFTSSSGCSSSAVNEGLNNPGAPIIDPISDYVTCAVDYTVPDPLVAITGSNLTGGQGFFSSPGGVGPIAQGTVYTTPTNSVIYAYDNNGTCSAEIQFNVIVNVLPTAAITPNPATLCEGNSIVLNGNPSGGSGVYLHSWTGDVALLNASSVVNPSTITSATFGTYNLTYTVTDNQNCVGSDNIIVTINQVPTLILNNPAAVCAPSTVDLTAVSISSTDVGTLGYFTDGGFTTPVSDPTAVSTGIYYVQVNNLGCTADGSLTVVVNALPVISMVGTDPTVCNATDGFIEVTLSSGSTSSGTLDWSGTSTGSNTSSDLTVDSPDISGLGSGNYDVVFTDANGCVSTVESISLSNPGAPSLNPLGPIVACNSYTLPVITGTNLSGSQAYFTAVSGGGAQIPAGTVWTVSQTIYMYDVNGACFDQEQVDITIHPLPTATISGGGTYCLGDAVSNVMVSVTGSADWTVDYTFNGTPLSATGSTSPISLGNIAGNYILTGVTDANCSNSAMGSQTITINPIPLAPTAGTDTTYCSNWDVVPMTASGSGGTMTWYLDASLNSVTTSMPSQTLGTTIYYVTETVATCEGPADSVTITIEGCDIIIPTAFTPDGDGINDVWEILDLDAVYTENVVMVFNRWGNKLFESEKGAYSSRPWDGTFEGEALPVGSYYFIIDFNDEDIDPAKGIVSIILNK